MAPPPPTPEDTHVTLADAPEESQYLRFDLEELGDQFGVRAGDLVRAIEAHNDEHAFHVEATGEHAPAAAAGVEEAFSGQGLVMTILNPDHATPEVHEEPASRGLLSELLQGNMSDLLQGSVTTEPQAMENSMSGVLCPVSTIMEDMQAEAEAEILSSTPGALSDLEAPLLFGHSADDAVSRTSKMSRHDDDEQAHGYLVKVPNMHARRMSMESPGFPPSFDLHQALAAELTGEQEDEAEEDSYLLAMPPMSDGRDLAVALPSLVMPSDIDYVVVSAESKESQEPTLSLTVVRKAPIWAYLMLGVAILGISVIGSAYRMESPAHPLLKSLWRSFVAMAVMSPWVAGIVWIKPRCLKALLQWPITRDILITAIAQSQYIFLFVAALNYTGMATAFLLSNCHSMIIVVFRLVTGETVTRMEALGVLISLGGAGLTIMDHSDQPGPKPEELNGALGATALPALAAAVDMVWTSVGGSSSSTNGIVGGLLGLLSGVGGAVYVTAASRVRHKVEFSIFMWMLFAIHVVLFGLLLVIVAIAQSRPISDLLTFDMHPYTGFFGFASKEQIFSVFLTGIVGSLFGVCLYVAVIKYLKPVVVSVAMLSESFVGVFSGVLLHEANWPSLIGWVGSVVSVAGAVVVIVGDHKKDVTTVIKPHHE